MNRIERDTMIYDGSCGLCVLSARLAEKIDRRQEFSFVPNQTLSRRALRRIGTSRKEAERFVLVVQRDGRVYRGASAVNHFLARYFPFKVAVAVVYAVPVVFGLEWLGYELVSRNRHRLSRWLGLQSYRERQPQRA